MAHRALGFEEGQTLSLGRHTLRFLETPHVHHGDSVMVVEETHPGRATGLIQCRPALLQERRSLPAARVQKRTSEPAKHPWSAQPARVKPSVLKRRKSVEFEVASGASCSIAVAAIMQSTSEPRRRPE